MPCIEAYREHIMYTFNGFCKGKWRCFRMENPNLLPYETIVRASSGEPEAVDKCSGAVK